MSEKDSSEDEADDIESTMCADNDDDDSRYAVMPNYFRHAPKAKEATPYYLKEKQGLDPVAEDDEVSEMPAPRPQSNKPPAKAGPKMYEGDNAGPSPKAKKPKASSAAKNSTGKSGDTTTQDMGTQFPDVMPAEVEFDEEEHEPPPAPEHKPPAVNLDVPTDEAAMRAEEYDPRKFWGFDLMFQFPWDTMESNKQERMFNMNKMNKDEDEMNEFMELARLKRKGPEYAIRQDYSPEMFAARCGAAGLFTSISSDPENIYIRIGADWERYEKEAERTEFRKRVKQEYMNPAISDPQSHLEPGLNDEDPWRPAKRDREMAIYIPFQPEKRERFAFSILAPNNFFSSGERQRLCQSIIEAEFVNGGAEIRVDPDSKRWGYLPGAPICLPDYEERDRLERIWHGGSPFSPQGHPNVFWRQQPFHEIREYYGEAVTLYYAWMDCYIEWLVALSICGSVCWILYQFKSEWGYLENALCFYGAFVIFWGIFFMEAWNRREADLVFQWDCLGTDIVEREYWDFPNRAELKKHPITQEWENYFDDEIRDSRMNKSLAIMALFMFLGLSFNIGAVILGGYLQEKITFQAAVGPAIASMALVVAQQVTKFIWDAIAEALTDWETHKYVTDYDQQLGFKVFGFELVMKFGAIFFIAFFKGPLGKDETFGIKGCKDKDGLLTNVQFCDYELMMQLLIVFLAEMTIGQFTEVVIPLLLLKIKNYQNNQAEAEAAEANGSGSGSGSGAGVGVELKVEKGASSLPLTKKQDLEYMDEFGKEERAERLEEFYAYRKERGDPIDEWITEDQENEAEKESFWMVGGPNLDYQEMMIQFGFVTLFSIAFPIVPFLALLNNLIEIRTDSMGMNETMQRPQFRTAPDIGAWKGALNFMVWSSIVFNIVLMLYFNNYLAEHKWFDGSDQFTLVGVVIGTEHVLIIFKTICENLIPDRTKWLVHALEGVKAMEKRANRDFGATKNNWTGNWSERKNNMMETRTKQLGKIENEFKLYSDLKGVRADIRTEWEEKVKEERTEWQEKVAEAEKDRMEKEAHDE